MYEADFPLWGPTSMPNSTLDNHTFESIMISPLTTYSTLDTADGCSIGHDLSPSTSIDELDSLLNNIGGNNPSTSQGPFAVQDPGNIGNSFSREARFDPDIPHSCLNLALNIIPMLQVSPPTCALASISPDKYKTAPALSMEHTISTNRAITDSITLMLSCSCSLDEHLAPILSLIVFQILASYASAAKEADHIPNQNLTQFHDYSPSRLDQGTTSPLSNKICAQLILSELHRVVTVVEVLSTRFKEARGYADVNIGSSRSDNMGKRSRCISSSVFVQLEVDLRRRLTEVTNEVLEILRGG
ncbi:hypothetical protein B7463_g2670, partial [Scytalidium lignicola]